MELAQQVVAAPRRIHTNGPSHSLGTFGRPLGAVIISSAGRPLVAARRSAGPTNNRCAIPLEIRAGRPAGRGPNLIPIPIAIRISREVNQLEGGVEMANTNLRNQPPAASSHQRRLMAQATGCSRASGLIAAQEWAGTGRSLNQGRIGGLMSSSWRSLGLHPDRACCGLLLARRIH